MAVLNTLARTVYRLHQYTGCIRDQRQQVRIIIVCLVLLFLLNMFGDSPAIHKPCRLHKLDPWDKALMKYVTFSPPNQCANRSSLLYVDDNGVLRFNTSAIKTYSLAPLKCAYHAVEREGDLKVSFGKKVVVNPPEFIPCRIFRVTCNSGARTVYDIIHVNIAWNESWTSDGEIHDETSEHLSVFYIGFDSVSGSEVVRKAPLTYKFLTESLAAYHFQGSMKVGLNTYPNWIALLRGDYGKDLLFSHLVNKKFDDENFIWKDAKEANYVTAFIDDVPKTAPFRGKFQYPPTDYYYRPYSLAIETIEPVIVNKLGHTTRQCYGNTDQFLLQLDYFKRFVNKYIGKRKFVFFWNNQFTHDAPSLEKADKYLLEFFEWMKFSGHLDRAVLVFGSDHGFRLGGGASATYVGKLEMNMPALIVYFPEHVKRALPWLHGHLHENTKKLVTQYDVYETMKGVIHSDFRDKAKQATRSSLKGRTLYGPIPNERSCLEAGVPPNYCACKEDVATLDLSLPVIALLANKAVDKMNNIMITNKQSCVQLKLLNVSEAKVSYKDKGNNVIYGLGDFYKWVFDSDISGRYVIQFYTRPNDGFYQTVIDYEANPSEEHKDNATILGDPVRLNKYGEQAHCVEDSYLKQFCLCKDMVVAKLER